MIFALALLVHLHAAPDHINDRWFGSDKVKHFLVSAFIQTTSYAALRSVGARNGPALVGATLLTITFGVGKEAHDRGEGGAFSGRDLTWDILGAVAGSALVNHSRR